MTYQEPSLPPPVLHPVDSPALKEDAPCCAATRDEYGRYCIGFCGPECERRP